MLLPYFNRMGDILYKNNFEVLITNTVIPIAIEALAAEFFLFIHDSFKWWAWSDLKPIRSRE